ncbi:hypothetical protein XENOCAPTIV_027335 [Xenoophorus captivus]|uniref:PH domain-containing protein n=1 Tax=Xenoophorus captivus TaxID=1517983 RepID=A0ABV0QP93_9TELE
MSRRRISVKELGQPDHQGWLYRKKETKGFLGIKWKKYWFVLKKTALYWYTNQLGTLPPPYSSTAPVEASDLLSSRVSTMTSQSSASSLAKQRQSWLDLVSQASSTLAGETSAVQVHEQRLPQGSTEGGGASESVVPQDSSDSKGSNKERPAAIEQVLSDPEITSGKFREWKEANAPLMVEICVKDHRKGAPEAVTAAASVTAAPVAETSL